MKGVKKLLFFFVAGMILFSLALVIAQEDTTGTANTTAQLPAEEQETAIQETETQTETSEIVKEAEQEFENAEIEAGAGITPDSAFYFVEDGILSQFRSDLDNREKKVAEIKAMVEDGNIEAARDSLERYEEYAENFEREANPERRDDAFRSAVAIRRTINDIQGDIPEEEREDFANILEQEEDIITATEISSKIKELCEALSKLDPLEYSRICKTEENAPRWQRDLNQKLTAEQEQEAEVFFDIMSECFETSGRKCRCEEISVSSFAEKCSIISPLAAACNEGDKDACDEMEEIEKEEPIENLLPDYLQNVLARLEGRYDEGRYEMNMPPECIKEGATTSKECVTVMFKTHAPEECRVALERGEIDPSNEREAREACDRIMFELNAPPECIEAGITDPRECGKIAFQVHAPQECLDAGLTGENRGDDKKCREIMESQFQGQGPQGGFGGGNCKAIQDSAERLKCYDSASQGFGQQIEKVEGDRREVTEYRQNEGQKCPDGICDEFESSHSYACPEDCGGVREQYQQPPQEFQQPYQGEITPPPGEFIPPIEQPQEPVQEPMPAPTESAPASEPTLTGGVIFNFDNRFSSYYFR